MGLNKVIDRIESTPLNVGSLKKLLPKYCTFKTVDELNGHRSKVFGKYRCVVVLIPSNYTKIGHFVVLIARKRSIEYFSSLGGSPESELDKLGQPRSKLLNLLGRNYTYNRKQLQSDKSDIHSCAVHVLSRVVLWSLKLKEYTNLFTRKVTLQNPDEMVSMMTMLHLAEHNL